MTSLRLLNSLVERALDGDEALQLFIENLRDARLAVGIEQAELSRRIGATPAYINNIEHGRKMVTAKQAERIVEALRMPQSA